MQPNQPPQQQPHLAPHPVQPPQFQPTPHFGSGPLPGQPYAYPPQQSAVPPMPASGTLTPSTYDFIMNPAKPARKSNFSGGAMRVLTIVIIVCAVLFGGLYALKSLGGTGGIDKPSLLSVAQDQVEISHLSTLGTQSAVSDDVKNFAFTTQLSFNSIQATFMQYLAKEGYKPSTQTLALKQSAATDATLTAAVASSTFDPTFTQTMQTELQTYQHDLSVAYNKAGPNGKKILKTNYNSVTLILAQMSSSDS